MTVNEVINEITPCSLRLIIVNAKLKYKYNKSFIEQINSEIKQMQGNRIHDITNFHIPMYQMPDDFMHIVSKIGEDAYYYYSNIVSKTSFMQNTNLSFNNAKLDYLNKHFCVALPHFSEDLNMFVKYCHELGHAPRIINQNEKEYHEYFEVLPMIFEYLSYEMYYGIHAKDVFVNERMKLFYCNTLKSIKQNISAYQNGLEKRKSLQTIQNCYRYIQSLEYTLNIIEYLKYYRFDTLKLIEQMILGSKSAKTISEELNINTDGNKKLIYEYQIRR